MTELHFDVIGADGPKRYFESLAPGALAHAYLFSGPPGVGKKTFARRLAQSLLCLAPKTRGVIGYDGTCSSCVLFRGESAHHPDFLEHEGVLKIGDPDAAMGFYEGEGLSARDLVRQLSMRSYSGGMRVLLLGDVDFATHHAANALLKFLEEPPEGVVMVMTTAAPDRLLPTIRSRLIDVRFPLLSNAAVKEVLERMEYAPKDAELGASLSGGNVTRAVDALEGEEESLRAQVVRWFFESRRRQAAARGVGDPRDARRRAADDQNAGARLDRRERPRRRRARLTRPRRPPATAQTDRGPPSRNAARETRRRPTPRPHQRPAVVRQRPRPHGSYQ